MTIALLLIILCVGLLLAIELVHLGRATPGLPEPAQLDSEIARARKYEPMGRLFARREFSFASGFENNPAIEQRLRKNRRRVMALYLKEIRHDFHRAWSTCRLLAPFSTDPEFGSMLAKQLGTFYTLYLTLQFRLLVGSYSFAGADVENLVTAVRSLQINAQQIVQGIRTEAFQGSAA
jgi:hypothetical protein